MIQWIKNKIKCMRQGHDFARTQATLGGVWIKCTRCGTIDEHLPGLHEPKGYNGKM